MVLIPREKLDRCCDALSLESRKFFGIPLCSFMPFIKASGKNHSRRGKKKGKIKIEESDFRNKGLSHPTR